MRDHRHLERRWAARHRQPRSEGEALDFIRRRIGKDTIVHADESTAWNPLHGRFVLKRINHQEAYSLNDACTNDGELLRPDAPRGDRAPSSYRGAIPDPVRTEMAWREDHRHDPNGSQVDRVVALVNAE
jgi:hypothetical protein